jgi:hypothetical protein
VSPLGCLALAAYSLEGGAQSGLITGGSGLLMLTADGGDSWLQAALPAPAPVIATLLVSPDFGRGGTLLAGTLEDGVFVTGAVPLSPAAWNFGLLDVQVLCGAVSPGFEQDHTAYIGTSSGIYITRNAGRSWKWLGDQDPTNNPCADTAITALNVQLGADGSGFLLAGTEAGGLYRYELTPGNWKRLAPDILTGEISHIVCDHRCGELLIIHQSETWWSQDDGQSWQRWHDLSGVVCLAAPLGLGTGVPCFVGLDDGTILKI